VKILKGPCPNCGTDNVTYFEDIFTGGVGSLRGASALPCMGCGYLWVSMFGVEGSHGSYYIWAYAVL
jgi:hypothetical protein